MAHFQCKELGFDPWSRKIPDVFPCLFNVLIFWLCWVLFASQAFLLFAASRGYSLVAVNGLLIAVASLVAEHRL